MYEVFADLHIHIGRREKNKPIKITMISKKLKSVNFLLAGFISCSMLSEVFLIDCFSSSKITS